MSQKPFPQPLTQEGKNSACLTPDLDHTTSSPFLTVVVEVVERSPIWSQKSFPHPSLKTPLPMTKLPQAPKMGVGVHEVVEMYATSLCDTEPVVKKEPAVSSSCGHEFKRRLSEITQDSSPRPVSPADLPSNKKIKVGDARSPSPADPEEAAKRTRLQRSPATPNSDSDSDSKGECKIKESYISRRKRFLRTAEALRQSGLLGVTMKTAELLRKNHDLQREIEDLQRQTKNFVLSVLSNPENRHILENIRSGAQLYEVVVPGSQGIMSVTTQLRDINMNVSSGQTEMEAEDTVFLAMPRTRTEPNPSSTTAEADSGLGNHSPSSNYSCPSPASSVSSFSNDTSSLSDDLDSSEEENLSPPKMLSSANKKPH